MESGGAPPHSKVLRTKEARSAVPGINRAKRMPKRLVCILYMIL